MLRRAGTFIDRAFRLIVLFAVARILAGLTIALFDRDAVAWGIELTLIVAATIAVCLIVALVVRRWSAPRPS
jgi:hypothetical protein